MKKALAFAALLSFVGALSVACGSSDAGGKCESTKPQACQDSDKCQDDACGTYDDKCDDDCTDWLKCTEACPCDSATCITTCQPKLTSACGTCIRGVESCGQQNCEPQLLACQQAEDNPASAAGSGGAGGSTTE